MAQKSISKRIQISRNGKVRRRATALGHSRANKTTLQMQRKKRERSLNGVKLGYLSRNLNH
jgi:hypothetical protein